MTFLKKSHIVTFLMIETEFICLVVIVLRL